MDERRDEDRESASDAGIAIRRFRTEHTEAVVALWEACGLTRPWNDPRADIARKLAVQPELFLVAEGPKAEGRDAEHPSPEGTAAVGTGAPALLGTVMAGYDGHRGWMYYLASDPAHRGRGIGRALVAEAERRLEAMGCPKSQLMVRGENERALGFYRSLDYELGDVLVLGRRLIED